MSEIDDAASLEIAYRLGELQEEISKARVILAGTDIGSLPNDMLLSVIAQKRMDEHYKYFWQVKDTCTRAEKAEAIVKRQRAALLTIADYDDHNANAWLKKTGRYTQFRDPRTVAIARAALETEKEKP